MVRMFLLQSPEELRALSSLVKHGNVENTATVWSVSRRKADDVSPWDGKIMIFFYGVGNAHVCSVVRIVSDEKMVFVADLKYNAALSWCRENHIEGRAWNDSSSLRAIYAEVHQK